MSGHERNRAEHSATAHGGVVVQYQMRERLFGLDRDFWIANEAGVRCFQVLRESAPGPSFLVLANDSGGALYRIQGHPGRSRDSLQIQDAGAGTSATVKLVSATVRDRLIVDLDSGAWLDVEGNTSAHEYEIHQAGTTLAVISKGLSRETGTYAVAVGCRQNDALILAITIGVDQITAS